MRSPTFRWIAAGASLGVLVGVGGIYLALIFGGDTILDRF